MGPGGKGEGEEEGGRGGRVELEGEGMVREGGGRTGRERKGKGGILVRKEQGEELGS